MLTVKCPHCATAMQLRQAPPSGKVKCPKCSKVVAVGTPAAAARPASGGQPSDPNDDNFDFGRINFPSAAGTNAVTHFPVAGNLSAYTGPIPGDPLQGLESGDGQPQEESAQPKGKKKKTSPMVWIVVIVVLLVLIIAGIVAAVLMSGGDGGAAPAAAG